MRSEQNSMPFVTPPIKRYSEDTWKQIIKAERQCLS